MSVDYRLLHHFRVSQRREMASRGELSVLRADEQSDDEPAVEPLAREDSAVAPAPLRPVLPAKTPALPAKTPAPPAKASARPAKAPALPAKLQRGQVLTHLLNEDR